MPDLLSDERLEEIQKRAEAAFPGPWYHTLWERVTASENSNGADSICHIYQAIGCQHSTGEFIAKARQDIPDLLAHIAAMKRGLAEAICLPRAIIPKSVESIISIQDLQDAEERLKQ